MFYNCRFLDRIYAFSMWKKWFFTVWTKFVYQVISIDPYPAPSICEHVCIWSNCYLCFNPLVSLLSISADRVILPIHMLCYILWSFKEQEKSSAIPILPIHILRNIYSCELYWMIQLFSDVPFKNKGDPGRLRNINPCCWYISVHRFLSVLQLHNLLTNLYDKVS